MNSDKGKAVDTSYKQHAFCNIAISIIYVTECCQPHLCKLENNC